ncbi:MAG: FIST N-terminal domain-containing protein [Thermoplasmatota archaeon]|jgi:hypothetical protein
MIEPKFEAAVGMSRKWDAHEAGREVAETAIQKLSRPPDFFLLFSTIHYEKHGGFQEFLDGVWDVLPKGTPLVGGTVAGFMNNYGVYVHGATALAVSYPNMDVAIGYGKNTKRNPKRAAHQSVEMIKNKLAGSQYKNKFLFNFVSGPELMRIPGQGYKKVINSGFMSRFIMLAFNTSQTIFQKGLGREDEIFEEITRILPNYSMLLGTSWDDYRGIHNYQFFNNNIFANSVLNLGISTDLDLDVCTNHGMKETGIKLKVTKLSRDKHIIHKINGQPARKELLHLLDWPQDFLSEKTMTRTILYYPISYKRSGREVPIVTPGFIRDSILVPCKIDGGNVSILTVSGKKLIDAAKDNLDFFNNIQPDFGLFSACITVLGTLGFKTDFIRKEMLKYFEEKPFILFWSAGEGTYSPKESITYANMSFNTAIFGHKNHSKDDFL